MTQYHSHIFLCMYEALMGILLVADSLCNDGKGMSFAKSADLMTPFSGDLFLGSSMWHFAAGRKPVSECGVLEDSLIESERIATL